MGRGSRHGIDRDEYLTRAVEFAARGNALPHAKLTPDNVRAIRENRCRWTRKQWADHLGVTTTAIDNVANYHTWRHVR